MYGNFLLNSVYFLVIDMQKMRLCNLWKHFKRNNAEKHTADVLE